MARKGRNIYKRKDGRWEGRIQDKCLKSQGGYKSFYGHTCREVKEKMEEYKSKAQRQVESGMTLHTAVELWLEDNRPFWKNSTYACYRQLAEKYIFSEMSGLFCSEVSNQTLREFQYRHGELSQSYIKNICAVMTKSLGYVSEMYGEDCVVPNHFTVCGQKSRVKESKSFMPKPEAQRLLEAYLLEHLEDGTSAGILIAMYTGLRIGELCALRWENIDLEECKLTVRGTMQRVKCFEEGEKTRIQTELPKSEASMRCIPLPVGLCQSLKRAALKEGYVIRGRKKAFAEPRTVQYRLSTILKKCGIPEFNFHMLRHAFASNCLIKGFDFKSLSEIMGHSNIQTTLSIYVHSNEEQKRLLMERLIVKF